MARALRIVPHADSDWLVIAGGSSVAVPPWLGRALLPLQGHCPDRAAICRQLAAAASGDEAGPGWGEAEAAALAGFIDARSRSTGRGRRRRALWLRIPLIPGRWTAAIAHQVRGLTRWPALAAMAAAGVLGYLAPWWAAAVPDSAVAAPAVLAPGLALFLVTALWHEFGHAAALAHEGYAPGGIGAGLLFVVPVMFADVTALGALKRAGRVRVDVAGVCFQLGLGGALFAAGARIPAARAAGALALFAVAWSLLPFIRSDGYWLLCDLLDVPHLKGPAPAGRSRLLSVFLRLFQLANLLFLALVVFVAGQRVTGLISKLAAIRAQWATPH